MCLEKSRFAMDRHPQKMRALKNFVRFRAKHGLDLATERSSKRGCGNLGAKNSGTSNGNHINAPA
jgi:hypothetical protein